MRTIKPELPSGPTPRAVIKGRQVFILTSDYEYTAFTYLVVDEKGNRGLYDEDGNLLQKLELTD